MRLLDERIIWSDNINTKMVNIILNGIHKFPKNLGQSTSDITRDLKIVWFIRVKNICRYLGGEVISTTKTIKKFTLFIPGYKSYQ